MNILFIAHERNMGGASKSLVTLVEEIKERGNEVRVILPIRYGQVYKELVRKEIPVKVIFFGWWMYPFNWNWILKLGFRFLHLLEFIPAHRIARIASKNNVQIIHSNSSTIDVGAKAASIIGLPHIWHFREFGDKDYNLTFLQGRNTSCNYVNMKTTKIVYISQALHDYYQDTIEEEKSCVIYNGVSDAFSIDKYGEKTFVERDKPITFLISGNLHRNKRQDLVLEAAKILLERGNTQFRLYLAGEASALADSQKYKQELLDRVNEMINGNIGKTPEIALLGFVSDMRELRKEADVEIVCSSMEAFGRVTVEAMMSSNPVIASSAGANVELIEDGKNGFLFEADNAVELADRMEVFIKNNSLLNHMGKYAHQYACERFPSKKNSEKIEQLYKKVLESSADVN